MPLGAPLVILGLSEFAIMHVNAKRGALQNIMTSRTCTMQLTGERLQGEWEYEREKALFIIFDYESFERRGECKSWRKKHNSFLHPARHLNARRMELSASRGHIMGTFRESASAWVNDIHRNSSVFDECI